MIREQAGLNYRSRSFFEHPKLELSLLPLQRSPLREFKLLFTTPDLQERSMSMKLYVGNLAFQTSSEDLQQLFAQAGTVQSASVIEDRDTGRSRGFGFVEMASKEEGESAISQFKIGRASCRERV